MTKISRDAAKVFGEAYSKDSVAEAKVKVAREIADKRRNVLKKLSNNPLDYPKDR